MMHFYFTMLALVFLVGSATTAQAADTDPTYRVRSTIRKGHQQPKHRDLQDPFLTFSEDGAEREDQFFLDLFETPAQLTNSESPNAIQTAMNFFLLSELSARSTGSLDSVNSVTSEILSLATREDTYIATASGENTTRIGTEVRMRVYLKFSIKPSPEEAEVKLMMQQVMSNLTYFVTNLTSSLPQSSGEHELAGVYEAIRRELPTPPLVTPPNTTAVEGNQPSSGETDVQIVPNDNNNVAWSAVPIILVVAVLVVLLVFLVVRRRRREEPDESKNSAIMYMDVENELYSVDQSVETSQSPIHAMSPDASGENSIQYSMSGDEESMTRGPGDSIFSGIDTEYQNVRSSKSMMTGFTRASASTIQVSNKDRQTKSTTPKSYGANSSLFAFSEEGYDVEDDRDDHDAGLLGGAPSLTKSDISETSEELLFTEDEREDDNQHSPTGTDASTSLEGAHIAQPSSGDQEEQVEVVMQLNKPSAEETQNKGASSQQKWCGSSQVLADLGAMETSRQDPTPTMARAAGSLGQNAREATPSATVSYNIFNCNPVVEGNKNQAPALPSAGVLERALLDSGDLPKSPKHFDDGESNSMPTPQLRNGHARDENNEKSVGGITNSARSLISGIFRGGRKSLSNPPTPSKQKIEISEGAASAPSSPNKQVGGHWMTSTYPSQGWRQIQSPRLEGDEDYDINLSRPSSPGDELDDSIEYGKDDSYGFLQKFGMNGKQEPDSTTAEAGRGRRHVGDHIGGDGSAMYQTNAMQPLDWSLKSGDVNSVGESTISEKDDIGKGQYIFKKGRADIQTQGSLSPDMLENSKTPRSEATRESLNSRASASRQLINDLVWLERKIAGVRQGPDGALGGIPGIDATDSLSYVSNDNNELQEDSEDEEAPTVSTGQAGSVMSSIVCRDCYAPPGKLHIVIHSTKDGPAVHTVKEGSSLEGHIFPGDLIISVDNIDTRSYTAEQVMKMMAAKGNQERKITVLHFEEEE
jgi:hypothetical protein